MVSLQIDEKYNIQVIVNEFEGVNEDVETSTAQSISVIFAFIAGVIKMARQSNNPENEMLVSEPSRLVMDAPPSCSSIKPVFVLYVMHFLMLQNRLSSSFRILTVNLQKPIWVIRLAAALNLIRRMNLKQIW